MNKRHWDNDSEVAFYHIILKVPDNTDGNSSYAFKDQHKERLENLLLYLDGLYLPEVISFCIMSNHVHLVISHNKNATKDMTMKEIAKKYQKYYKLKQAPDARSREVRNFKKRINSLSDFMRDLQRRFTMWYNHQLERKRRGSLWNPRFKSTILKSGKALADCMKYVELNPVRAKLVSTPGEYRFCSWNHICRNSHQGNIFKARIVKFLRYLHGSQIKDKSDLRIFSSYAGDLETLALAVNDNKLIKRIDPYQRAFLLERCEVWGNLKVISGDESLVGLSYGSKRTRVFEFKIE